GRCPLNKAKASSRIDDAIFPISRIDIAFYFQVTKHSTYRVFGPAAVAQIIQNILRIDLHFCLCQCCITDIYLSIVPGIAEQIPPCISSYNTIDGEPHPALEILYRTFKTTGEITITHRTFKLSHQILRCKDRITGIAPLRSDEHTSALQSRFD